MKKLYQNSNIKYDCYNLKINNEYIIKREGDLITFVNKKYVSVSIITGFIAKLYTMNELTKTPSLLYIKHIMDLVDYTLYNKANKGIYNIKKDRLSILDI